MSPGDRGANPLARPQGVGQRRAGQDDGELFATVAGGQVHLADRLAERRGHVSQDLVAGLMAVRIVEFLEMIDVDHDQRERALAPLPFGKAAIHLVVQRPAIAQLGQRIGAGDRGLRFQLGGLPLQPDFGGGQLLLQGLVGLDDVADRFEHLVVDGELAVGP